MRSTYYKLHHCIVFLLLLATLLPYVPIKVEAAPVSGSAYDTSRNHYSDFGTVTEIGSIGGCPAMQGFDVDGTYLYSAKVNDGDTTATLSRTHKTTGEMVYIKNGDNGTNYFYQLAHANDLAVTEINGVKNLFVATGGAGVGDYSLVRLQLSGTTATMVGHYNVKLNGTESYLAGVKVMSVNKDSVDLIFKRGKYIFTGTVSINATNGDVIATQLCTLDLANSIINGKTMDLSAWVQQGFGYIDNKIFVPLSGNHQASTSNSSLIMVYDIEGVSGAITNDPTLSFHITSSTYADLFEIESCQVDPTDGKLYFNTNRRVTASDGNHDALLYIKNYIYDPARGDSAESTYRWEVINDELVSVTDDGAVFNAPSKKYGYISNGAFNTSRYFLSRSVILKHNEPWILEWKNTGGWTKGSLFFSNNAQGAYNGNRYLYRRQNSTVIALGEYQDGTYHNYGIELSAAGIDGTKTHTYTLKNRIASDGSNMVYLFVDGKEIGPMNGYFQGGTSQNTTSNWISGKDFTFSYLGSKGHPIGGCSIDYIQIWSRGLKDQYDEPNIFRWEPSGSAMTSVAKTGYTTNNVTTLAGSIASGKPNGYQGQLTQAVTLLHDRAWSIEWQCDSWSGNSMLLGTHERTKIVGAPYLYRSGSIVSLGYFDGTNFNNFGIKLADHGIDPATKHTYRMTNRIEPDGSNMVYLFIDGKEIGPMNIHHIGSTSQGVTSNWISGKDFTFPYIGTMQYTLSNPMSYLQVWEGGIPADVSYHTYRWEPSGNKLDSITTGFTPNAATILNGSVSGTDFSNSYFALEKSIVLLHDRSWSIQWRSQGSWKDTANGGMLLSASLNVNEPNAPYLYRRNDSTFIAFGERRDGYHWNYGVSLSAHGIDGTADHTYQLTNRVNTDGTNMVYLFVDGKEIGPMTQEFQGGTDTGTPSNWVSGKDFVFSYLGSPQFPIGNCDINYLQINEGCTHSYKTTTSAPGCTTQGTVTYTCTLCGDSYTETLAPSGHSYSALVTPPTCTAEGYTTYTCDHCGDSYTGDTTEVTDHDYASVVTKPTCTAEGYTTYTCRDCGHSYKGDTTPRSEHSYDAVVTVPTCTAEGYTTYTCELCGDSYKGDVVGTTGHNFVGGSCNVCGEVCVHDWLDGKCTICRIPYPVRNYYLFGWINGADYACEGDFENMGIYKFVGGKLTAIFREDSYVAVKAEGNADWYMAYAYPGEGITACTLFNTRTGSGEKLFVPGGKQITFTLMDNGDDSFTLSYVAKACPHEAHDQSGICAACGQTVSHSYTTVTTPATCTMAGSTVSTCTGCGHSHSETIPAKGHSYVGGTCTGCGQADPDAVKDPGLVLNYPTLSFEDEIIYNVYFSVKDTTSIVEMGLMVLPRMDQNATITDAIATVPGYVTNGFAYLAKSEGIPAANMGDTLYFKVYAKLTDGTYAYSAAGGYNAKAYASSILSGNNTTEMKALVVSMLNYGAEAQLFFDHNTDKLVNSALTAEQQALVSAYDATMMDALVKADANKTTNFVRVNSNFRQLYPSVSFDGAFAINFYCVPTIPVDSGMTLYFWDMETMATVDKLSIDNASGTMEMSLTGGIWWGQVAGIAAKEMDKTYYVTCVFESDGQTITTGVIPYSLGKYCSDKAAANDDPQQSFAQATAVYGYYAKSYFASIA